LGENHLLMKLSKLSRRVVAVPMPAPSREVPAPAPTPPEPVVKA
jgi:hypothetical protein